MQNQINIINRTSFKINKKKLLKIIENCIKIMKFKRKCEIDLVLVDDKEIKKLNYHYRKINASTDVLSFPLWDKKNEKIDFPHKIIHLGEIIISIDKVKKQSRKFKHSLEKELALLIIHGFLHLLGYNHNQKKNKKEMFFYQEKILNSLNLE